jgi:hypothetical protein
MEAEKKKRHITPAVMAIIALVTFALSMLAFAMPNVVHSGGNSQPPLVFLAVVGLVVIAGMSLVLWIAMKLGLGLSRSTLFATLAFNVALIIVKFILAPLGLYLTNQASPFSAQTFLIGINNDSVGFWFAAAGSFVAYALSLWIIYKVASHGLDLAHGKRHHARPWLLFFAALIVVGVLSTQLYTPLSLVILPAYGLSDYLSKLQVMLPAIAIALFAAVMLAVSAFKSAAADAKAVGRPALLASLFWLCLCLVLMYHVLWVVFMTALVTIWPFKTFIPNSK